MMSHQDKYDAKDMEGPIQTYQQLLTLQQTYQKDLLKQPLKFFNKLENGNVQGLLLLNRVDEANVKAFGLKLKMRQQLK